MSIQKRAKGKKVTVIQNLHGSDQDKGLFLKALKDCVGAGGVLRANEVEVQGEHEERIKEFLLHGQHTCALLNVAGGAKPKPPRTPPPPAAAERAPSSSTPRVAPTPSSKDQKQMLLKIVKAASTSFLAEHALAGCTGNQLAKLKYSSFVEIWKSFAQTASEAEWRAVAGR